MEYEYFCFVCNEKDDNNINSEFNCCETCKFRLCPQCDVKYNNLITLQNPYVLQCFDCIKKDYEKYIEKNINKILNLLKDKKIPNITTIKKIIDIIECIKNKCNIDI